MDVTQALMLAAIVSHSRIPLEVILLPPSSFCE